MFEIDLGASSDVVVDCTRLRAPYGLLVQLLGAPSTDLPEKCSTLWSFREIGERENVVYLQDFQDEDDRTFKLSEFRALPAFDWNVCAETVEIATRFCEWLSKRVIAKASEVKTLSPEGRVALRADAVRFADRYALRVADSLSHAPDGLRRIDWPFSFAL